MYDFFQKINFYRCKPTNLYFFNQNQLTRTFDLDSIGKMFKYKIMRFI